MQRRAFALLETLVVIGVIGALTTLSIPMYREYQIRGDLDNATQQATQGLARAKLLSQLGQQDSQWGFYVPSGTLYKGTSYASRISQYDEVYPMPSTIAVSGLLDVSYTKVRGAPSATGSILLRALNNDQRVIQVTIAVDTEHLAATEGDNLTICHYPSGNPAGKTTITIPDSTWPSHQAHGDTMGACSGPAASSSSAAARSSSSRSSSVSSQASSSAAGGAGGGSATCASKFTVAANGTITTTASTSVTFTNMEAQITFGSGGPAVPVHVCYSTDGGATLSSLYGGNGNCKGNGNAYGNAVDPNGTDTKTVTIPSGKQVAIQVNGRYKQNGWLAFDETYLSNDGTGHVHLMQNGSQIANYPGFGSQASLKTYLIGKGKANASGVISLGACELLAVSELGTLNTSASDFQDDVMLMTFN
jgi:type II secretory pathway pseudopilin PulG